MFTDKDVEELFDKGGVGTRQSDIILDLKQKIEVLETKVKNLEQQKCSDDFKKVASDPTGR